MDWQVGIQDQNQECAEFCVRTKCSQADRQRLHQNLPGGGLLLLGHMHSFKRFCGVKPMPTTVNVLGKSWGLNVQGFCCRFLGYSLEPPKSSPGYDTCPPSTCTNQNPPAKIHILATFSQKDVYRSAHARHLWELNLWRPN